jgi:hypothetical protein
MRRLVPASGDLIQIGSGGLLDEKGVGRKKLEERAADRLSDSPSLRLSYRLGTDGQHRDIAQLLQRPLGGKIEAAQGDDVVPPPLQPGRCRHAEAVQIQDSSPDAELRHLGHRGYSFVAHGLQGSGYVGRGAVVAHGQRQAQTLECRRQQSSLRGGPCGRDQHPEPALEQRLDGLRPLPRDLVVRLVLAQSLTLGIERSRYIGEMTEVREPSLGLGR